MPDGSRREGNQSLSIENEIQKYCPDHLRVGIVLIYSTCNCTGHRQTLLIKCKCLFMSVISTDVVSRFPGSEAIIELQI